MKQTFSLALPACFCTDFASSDPLLSAILTPLPQQKPRISPTNSQTLQKETKQ